MATDASARARIRCCVVGVGNCASALLQGLVFYRDAAPAGEAATAAVPATRPGLGSPGFAPDAAPARALAAHGGLMRAEIGGYRVGDVDVVLAFDVDARKVGRPVREAIVAPPNCCFAFAASDCDAPVLLAPLLDGVAPQVASPPADAARGVVVHADAAGAAAPTLAALTAAVVRERCDVLINYLPVGSQVATELWANVAIAAGCAMVNCIPVFIASSAAWEAKFVAARLPIIGDDMKSQFGASIVSQMLQELALDRGHVVRAHIQQNSGGNTDFFNMTDRARLASKKISKENVIGSINDIVGVPRESSFLFAGPSDYVRPEFARSRCSAPPLLLRTRPRPHRYPPGALLRRPQDRDIPPRARGLRRRARRLRRQARRAGEREPVTQSAAPAYLVQPSETRGVSAASASANSRPRSPPPPPRPQDSPNSAGVVIDAIRYVQVARELGIVGALRGPSAFTQKSPPVPLRFRDALDECNALADRRLTATTAKQVAKPSAARE